jgi:hypothetical protein
MSTTDRAAIVLQQIDAALALAEKATPGPWDASDGVVGCNTTNGYYMVTCDSQKTSHAQDIANAACIAASRTLMPASLQIIRDDIKAWLELRDSLKVGRDDVTTWDFCQRRLTAICDTWRATQ